MVFYPEPVHDAEWHTDHYTRFAHAKLQVGEPRPHLTLLAALSEGVEREELLWRVGLYLNCYAMVPAEAIWTFWPHDKQDNKWEEFYWWLRENWAGVYRRHDRRAVGTPTKFAVCLESWKSWCATELPRLQERKAGYDEWYDSSGLIAYFGPYIQGPMIYTMNHFGFTEAAVPDFRGSMTPNPRLGLGFFRPEHAAKLMVAPEAWVNKVAVGVRNDILARGATLFGYDGEWLSWYHFSVLMCEYTQGYRRANEYPGYCHDEELAQLNHACHTHWKSLGFETRLYEARRKLFPPEVLGELNGWKSMRPHLGSWLKRDGVIWSDLVYDWEKSFHAERAIER